jgi:hypothetical protein
MEALPDHPPDAVGCKGNKVQEFGGWITQYKLLIFAQYTFFCFHFGEAMGRGG